MRHQVEIPARSGRAFPVRQGERVRIIDIDGGQVADVFGVCQDDHDEFASADHTRVHVNRLFPATGEMFVTNKRRPIFLFEEDTSPGVHDMLVAACDSERYHQLGFRRTHPSCSENMRTAFGEVGLELASAPQCIAFFMNILVRRGGVLVWEPALSAPGDSVTLRAQRDCFVAVSACPQDIVPINRGGPSALAVEVF